MKHLKRKLDDYANMGVLQIWVVDPEDGRFSCYQNKQLMRSQTFADPERSIRFDTQEIAKRLRR